MAEVEGGFGVYVHWPYCLAKCPYCDFNSHVTQSVDHAAWRDAYAREIAWTAAQTPDRRVDTVFFGGGTPSLMEPETVHSVLEAIRAAWPMADGAEVSLEANPTSVEAGKFRAFRDAGVNRISMGVQALNDADLRRLGRMHSVAEAQAAFDIARNAFDRVSFDLIYVRQGQTLDAWREELQQALDMAVDHLSLYQLTIEPGTRFGDLAERGKLRDLPPDDRAADMYDLTQQICTDAGMPAYEVSNHARPGAESRHNLVYWRYGEYAGIGPGAHGRITRNGQRIATDTAKAPQAWLERVAKLGHGVTVEDALDPADQGTEYLLMALRLREGASLRRYSALSGATLPTAAIAELVDARLLDQTGDKIAVTEAGRPVLNAVLRRLLT
ncbi:oxygen-independent coproporphyrinogen-3 oxidase [Rubricella aquisinus]|uniref:Heme chaperone HemW n=1 Tax=Rubricella aquisinus TaxID=2028108 RepID=A0A840WXR8_9RHOB|nr:oxygen-independent coproporphyrinogen-3 oxidase [Rubricella aquisinus]